MNETHEFARVAHENINKLKNDVCIVSDGKTISGDVSNPHRKRKRDIQHTGEV